MQRIFQKLETTITGGAILIATASLISRLLGLVRDRLLFSTFGAGDVLDSYYVAFRLPDLLFNILVLGALSSAFIPMFLEYRERHSQKNGTQDPWELANGVLTILLFILFVLGLFGFIFAPQLVPLFAPGFEGQKLHDAILLTRIMLLSILFFAASNVVSSMLNALKRFFAFAIAPIFYNLGILVGIVVFYPLMGLAGLGWGVALGAVLHLLVQLPSVFRQGYRFRWALLWRHPGVRRVFRLMLPRTIGLSAVQIDQTVSTMIASTLAVGSVSVLNAAQNLQSFPINIFGVSLAVSSFPVLSQAVVQRRSDIFVHHFSVVFRRILFYVVPAAVLLLLLRAHFVRLILGAGEFDWNDTILTAQCLGFFSLSLFAQSLIPMLARSFYALQDTATPARISIGAVILNVLGSLWFSREFGVIGLALSFTIVSAVQMLALLVLLRLRIGDLDDNTILLSTIKIIVGSAFMALAVWATLHVFALGVNQETFVGILIQAAGAGSVGVAVYLGFALAFRFSEVQLIAGWLKRALALFRNGKAKRIEN
ncbi:MAG: murein biosynthesis integral membrane protein MurJ [Candidatus Kerfeldbacteria bacterium]|nr:murein biosynthesis integral membrane protein MurJ [Candidatus Kerfeldbacteria bacterium]